MADFYCTVIAPYFSGIYVIILIIYNKILFNWILISIDCH